MGLGQLWKSPTSLSKNTKMSATLTGNGRLFKSPAFTENYNRRPYYASKLRKGETFDDVFCVSVLDALPSPLTDCATSDLVRLF